jgi:hypothetical protein
MWAMLVTMNRWERDAYLLDIDKLVELFHDLLQYTIGSRDDDCEESFVFIETHSQRFNVVSTSCNNPSNPVDHSALVPNEHGDSVSANPVGRMNLSEPVHNPI